jgi:hypothetical protein
MMKVAVSVLVVCISWSRLVYSFRYNPRSSAILSTRQFAATLGPPLSINEEFKGIQKVHSNPDVYVIEKFLDETSCLDMIKCAKAKKLGQSPVAYAGWTKDVNELLELAAKGPVSWFAIGGRSQRPRIPVQRHADRQADHGRGFLER